MARGAYVESGRTSAQRRAAPRSTRQHRTHHSLGPVGGWAGREDDGPETQEMNVKDIEGEIGRKYKEKNNSN